MNKTLVPVALSALLFGFWFKERQLNFISPDLVRFYPITFWLTDVFFIFLFFTLFALFVAVVFKSAFVSGALSSHLFAFFLITVVYLFSFCFFSPFFWEHPLTSYVHNSAFATGAIPTSAPLFKTGYMNAKFHSFSELDPSYWGGVARPLTGAYSLLVPVAAFFFNLPAADVESYHRLLFIITFVCCVLGSFGFYLFLFRGVGLSYAVSIFGGALLVFSNRFFTQTLVTDYPVYYIYFTTLPYAMYFIRRGFKKSSSIFSAASGLVLAVPLYILAPHPQSALLALLFYGLYVIFLFIFNEEGLSFFNKLKLVLVAAGAAGLGAVGYLAPAIDAVARGDLFYFGHKELNRLLLLTNNVSPETGLATAAVILFCFPGSPVSRRLRGDFKIFACLFFILQFIRVPILRIEFGKWTGLLAYEQLSFRLLTYYSFAALILFLFGLEACIYSRKKWVWISAALGALFFIFLVTLGVKALKSGQETGNFWGSPADRSCTYMNHYKNLEVLSGVHSPFKRILFATGNEMNVGLGGNLLLNNVRTGIDGRYMAGFPPMHFLYYAPGYNFINVGRTDATTSMGWTLRPGNVMAPANRKLLNIAGADIFVMDRAFFETIGEREDFSVIPYVLPLDTDPDYSVVEDRRSYGLAYLAQSIRYEDSGFLQMARQNFEPPFYVQPPFLYLKFMWAIQSLRKTLSSLKNKYDIVMENSQKSGQTEVLNTAGSTLKIENFIGNRAAFRVHCEKGPCRLVFNTSAIHGWRAFSDAKELPVERANYAFLSVLVPKGDHLVWFEHRLTLGVVASFVSLLTFIGFLFISNKRFFSKSALRDFGPNAETRSNFRK